jgi:hypothetical protein
MPTLSKPDRQILRLGQPELKRIRFDVSFTKQSPAHR